MAVTIDDIKKLRTLTGAGLADCKKALIEANGDMDKAIEIVRERGLAIAAKRSGREASNGCVLVKVEKDFGAMIALKCETDFVAMGKDYIKLTQDILDAAVANRAKSLEEIEKLKLSDGTDIATAVKLRSGVVGEKMELDGYLYIEGGNIESYNHMNGNILCTLVQTNKPASEVAHNIALQVASMNPVALDENSVPQEIKDREWEIAVQKTKEELVEKAVQNALRKAGYNLYIAESDEHIAEGIRKNEITEAQGEEIRRLKAETSESAKANLKEQMVNSIANGRMKKFFKENCLLEQEYIWDSKMTINEYLQQADKELKVVDFKRFTLRAE